MLNRREGLIAACALATTGLGRVRPALAAAPAEIVLAEQRGRFLAEVEVAGDAARRFVLDTGASSHFISADLARRLGLRTVEERYVRGHEGRARNPVVEIPRMRIGGLELPNTRAIVWEPDQLEGHDGLIGYPILFPRAQIDLEAGRLSLRSPAAAGSTRVSAEVLADQTLLLGGLPGAEGRFVLDTGAQHTIISRAYLERIRGLDSFRTAERVMVGDDQGVLRLAGFQAPAMQFGDLVVENLMVRIARPEASPEMFHGVDGLVGVSFLRRYAWTLDQPGRTLHVHPSPTRLGGIDGGERVRRA